MAALIDQAAAGELPKTKRPAPIIAETLVGGIYEVIYSRVLAGRYAELPSLLPDLVFALLQPYVGSEVAQEIFRRNGASSHAPARERQRLAQAVARFRRCGAGPRRRRWGVAHAHGRSDGACRRRHRARSPPAIVVFWDRPATVHLTRIQVDELGVEIAGLGINCVGGETLSHSVIREVYARRVLSPNR